MPRKYTPIAEQGRPNKTGWPKLSTRKPVVEVLSIILKMRGWDEHDIYKLIEEGVTKLPEYRRAYDLLKDLYQDLPPPE